MTHRPETAITMPSPACRTSTVQARRWLGLLGSISLSALAATPALAQIAPPPPPAAPVPPASAPVEATPVPADPPAAQADSNQPPTATPEQIDDAAPQEDEVVVTGRAWRLYRVSENTTGKLPTEPLASSQLITTLTEQLIADQGARTSQDLYRNISGVTSYSYAGVTARGFNQEENFYDGLRGDPYNGFSVPQLFNMERVEFLKGPAGMLYGQAAPGGIFNYISKRPRQTFQANVRGILGTGFGTGWRGGGSADVTGPLTGELAGRVGAFYEYQKGPRYNADSKVFIADGSLLYETGFGRIFAQLTHYGTNLGGNRLRGVPVDNDGNFLANRRWNGNEKEDFLRLNSTTGQVRIEGNLASNLTFDLAGRYINATEKQEYHNPRALIVSNGKAVGVTREFRKQLRNNEIWSFGANAIWSNDLGDKITSRTLFGSDFSIDDGFENAARARGATGSTSTSRVPTPLYFDNPAYGMTNRANYLLDPNNPGTDTRSLRLGFYALEELTIDKLILTGGIRYDTFNDRSTSYSIANQVTENVEVDDNAITYRAGMVYRATPEFSIFGQYATSFEPQDVSSQRTAVGGPFDATTGDMIETGLKGAFNNGRIQPSIAFYRIRRNNVVQNTGVVNGQGFEQLEALGAVTSRGIDFDLSTDITPNWVATMTYAYNKTRVTSPLMLDTNGRPIGGGVGDIGRRFANSPEHAIGAWTRYQIPRVGLAFAFGADYVSKRLNRNNQTVKPYVVFDTSIIYEKNNWKALLRIDNLFDKTYATSGFTDVIGHFPGAPRSAFIEVSRKF